MEKRESLVGTVVEQATAVFDGAEITAIRAADGFIYASLAHLCRALGLDQESQRASIEGHAVLSEGLLQFPLISGTRVVTHWCLRTNLIALWLATVPVKRLKLEKQARIAQYQRQVADILHRLFGALEAKETAVVASEPAYAEGLAIARMAVEQAEFAHQKIEAVDSRVASVEARLLAMEARLMPQEQISEEQAAQVADLVKQAALALAKKMGGGNYFGTIYGQLYRSFGITSYKLLTMAQYPKAVAWLEKQIRDYGN